MISGLAAATRATKWESALVRSNASGKGTASGCVMECHFATALIALTPAVDTGCDRCRARSSAGPRNAQPADAVSALGAQPDATIAHNPIEDSQHQGNTANLFTPRGE